MHFRTAEEVKLQGLCKLSFKLSKIEEKKAFLKEEENPLHFWVATIYIMKYLLHFYYVDNTVGRPFLEHTVYYVISSLSGLDLLGYRIIDMIELLVNTLVIIYFGPLFLIAGPKKCIRCVLPHFAISKHHFGSKRWNWTTQRKNPEWSSFWWT